MDALMALGWLLTHLGRSRRQHPNVRGLATAIERIKTRFELAQLAAGSPGSPANEALFAKNLLQVAALCVRSVVDLSLKHEVMVPLPDGELGTQPWNLSASDGHTTVSMPITVPSAPATTSQDQTMPDWAGGPNLYKRMPANADDTGAAVDPEANSMN